jgi:hypothetical protein
LFLIIIVRIVDTIAATVMGKKEDLRAAKRVAKAKLSPKPKEQRARRRADQARKGARALQRAEEEDLRAAKRVAKAKLSPKPKEQRARRRADQARKGARALQRAENLAQQLAQVLPTSAVATRAVASSLASAAATATTFPCITSPWQLGNIVECDVPGDKTCTVIIQSIGISTTNSAEVWLDDPVDPFAGESFTVLLSALRPVGWVVDPEYEALMASKLIESNRCSCLKHGP